MVTFKDLGNQGQFGNQLFQIAATIGIATKHGYDYGFPEWSYQKYFKHPLPKGEIWPDATYYEPAFHYNEVSVHDNTNLSGYFQSSKYFNHIDRVVRWYFEFDPELVERIKERFSYILKDNTCAIHVRRGDYVTNPNHHALTYDYYLKAMEHFKDVKFLVFSDDIPWCLSMFTDGFHIIENNSDIEDFILMSLCNHFIIANSTFSWWGSYLSKSANKQIIAPKKWFGPGLKHHITKDLIPSEWIVI